MTELDVTGFNKKNLHRYFEDIFGIVTGGDRWRRWRRFELLGLGQGLAGRTDSLLPVAVVHTSLTCQYQKIREVILIQEQMIT